MSAKKQKMGPFVWLCFWWCKTFHTGGVGTTYQFSLPHGEKKESTVWRCAFCQCCTRQDGTGAIHLFAGSLPRDER